MRKKELRQNYYRYMDWYKKAQRERDDLATELDLYRQEAKALREAHAKQSAERIRAENKVHDLGQRLAMVREERDANYHMRRGAEERAKGLGQKLLDADLENERLREEVEQLRAEVEHLEARDEVAALRARLYDAGKALEVLAPLLYKRYSPKGVLRWDDLITDAGRVREHNATTEALHFIEASQEGEPF